MLRLPSIALLMCVALIMPADAKTVRTDTIKVSPPTSETGINIPEGDLPSSRAGETQNTSSADDKPVSPGKIPNVLYDTELLPTLVQRMHDNLVEAARSGDMEKLRIVLEMNEVPPTLSLDSVDDPIEFIKNSSGDGQGLETLAILINTLEAGYVHINEGTAQEMYVWPYFAEYPLSKLTPEQKVEMYQIVTAAEFAEMEDIGLWLFYRLGIGKDGTLHYFLAGE